MSILQMAEVRDLVTTMNMHILHQHSLGMGGLRMLLVPREVGCLPLHRDNLAGALKHFARVSLGAEALDCDFLLSLARTGAPLRSGELRSTLKAFSQSHCSLADLLRSGRQK
jgi:hypothetical protein